MDRAQPQSYHSPRQQPPSTTMLYIVSDVRLYREGLALALSAHPSFDVIGARNPDGEAIEAIATAHPAVVLIDAVVVQRYDFVARTAAAAAGVKLLAFGVEDDEGAVIACAEAGVAGYVARDASLQDLVHSIEALKRDELHYPPRVAALLFRRVGSLAAGRQASRATPRLTSREAEVLGLLDEGLSNKEIARRLGIRLPTVKNHVHRVLEKLHVEGRTQAALRFRRVNEPQPR